MAYNILKHRRGTTQEWLDIDLAPEDGELVIEELPNGLRKCKLGDGRTKFSLLPYIDEALQTELLDKLDSLTTDFNSKLNILEHELEQQTTDVRKTVEDAAAEQTEKLIADYVSRDTKMATSFTQRITDAETTLQKEFKKELTELQSSVNLDLTKTSIELKADLEDTIETVGKSIEDKLSQVSAETDEAIDMLDKKMVEALDAEAATRKAQATAVLKTVTDLNRTVYETVLPTVDAIDSRLTDNVEALEKKHSDDLVKVQQTLANTSDVFEKKLTDQGDKFAKSLDGAIANINTSTDRKLSHVARNTELAIAASEQKQLDELANTKQELDKAIDDVDSTVTEAFTALNDKLTATDRNLSDALAQLEEQRNQITSVLSDKLTYLINKAKALEGADVELTNELLDIKGTIEELSVALSSDIATIRQRQTSNYAYLTKELSKLSDAQSSADLYILNSLSECLARFYVELYDLVDDDLAILETIFTLEHDLVKMVNDLDDSFSDKLNKTDEALSAEITTVKQTAQKELAQVNSDLTASLDSINKALTTNIENLRSSTNLRIGQNLTYIDRLDIELQDKYKAILNKFDEVEASTKQIKESINNSAGDLDTRFSAVDSRIDSTNDKLEVQTKRLNNIIALAQGSTTGDAELIDIRSGYNGLLHETAGDAVRAIGNELEALRNSLPEYIPANSVDGLHYEDNHLYLTANGTVLEKTGVEIVSGGGGGGGSFSTVKVTNNLESNTFTVAKGEDVWIDFTYTSFENEQPTGDGIANIFINDKKVAELCGTVQHNISKRLNVVNYLKNGANTVKVTCADQYGVSRSLVYNISIIELRIESTFNSTRIFDDSITFRYKIFGQIEKTVHIAIDGEEVYTKIISASVSGNESTYVIPKQTHGSHKITAYISAFVGNSDIKSNILEYEIICTESERSEAAIASVSNIKAVTQGDLVAIPYMVYDPAGIESTVDLIVYSQAAGQLTEVSKTTLTVNRDQQIWNTRQYPIGTAVFVISYTYSLHGVAKTITKSHSINVTKLDVDISAEEDSLQLHLSAQGRSNSEHNPAVWTFKSDNANEPEVTTSFTNLNWKTNGWIADENGDTCLRLNGDARAVINFKPFAEDFKLNGKTIEFEFVVRDVNRRDTVVIDCYDGQRGFRATPDTAFLQSSGTKVSCRYKDEERVRVAVSVEYADSLSRFVSIYLDGILSGVQRYATTDAFDQQTPLAITLGSNFCGLDVYTIRVYDKALSTPQILTNYIADKTVPSTKLQLMSDNDVLDENNKISYDRVKALGQLPIVTFTGQMPTYKGDKKKKSVRMKFEDPVHPELNFDVLLDQIDVQGTSSQFYVRKNWKVKLPEARPHMPGAIPAKVYCIKVDYAEATGTHNTGSANYIETLYDKTAVKDDAGKIIELTGDGWIPPQKDDTRIRTTIQGFPCIIFEKATEDSEPVFSSKGNFNYDKDAEDTFGFSETYKGLGVECWEFCNNTSDPVNFVGPISENWLEDFEPRYVPKSANFERIEELQELSELAASGKATMTEAQEHEFSQLLNSCIANFKEMHDWVLSTATYNLVEGKKVAITPRPLDQAVTYGTTTYIEDNEEYRLAKFKHEFTKYFNLHYSCIYYVFTLFALMTDQRAKNLFLTRWKDDSGDFRWYPYFYDNDTIFGINNEGALVFDYYHEDTDQLGSSNVYNGQNSVLWNNFRLCFPQEIQSTYAALRSDSKLTYDKIIDQFVTQGSDKWSAAIYNEDAEYKYVSMARQLTEDGDVDASNLYQVRGPGEHHLRYFVANRLNYCDSKWSAGKYPDDFIFLRIYTPTLAAITDDMTDEEKAEVLASNARIQASLEAVPANPSITVTPFSNMYAGVRYKSGTLQQQRLAAGESYRFSPLNPNETFGDTETAIYGASELSSLGDLSGLYCGVISLGKASKLVELKIGNASPHYHNDNFREISVGSNRLLKTIDLRNCSGLGIAGESPQKTLELSGCPNIEHIYTEGTNLESVELPSGGYIKTLHLPASINTLTIKNQQHISDFSVESYDNIKILCLENCPTLNEDQILAACKHDGRYTVERVRLTGINWSFQDASFLKGLFPRFDDNNNLIGGIRGIDDKNNNLDDAYLVGTCYIKKLSGAEYAEIKAHYPYLDIKFGEMTSNVTFIYEDARGVKRTHTEVITCRNSVLGTCAEPVLVNPPAWPENAAFTYEHVGWSKSIKQISNGINDSENDYLNYLHSDALLNIAGDRVLYPVFKAIRKYCSVYFINPTDDNKVLQVVTTPYGSDAIYTNDTPVKKDTSATDIYEFKSWNPKPENIIADTYCYAQFAVISEKWYTITFDDIDDTYIENHIERRGFSYDKTNKTLTIRNCADFNPAIRIPENLDIYGTEPDGYDFSGNYKIVSVGGFKDSKKLELVLLPETLEEILANSFENCDYLCDVTLPDSLKTIGKAAFKSCEKLTSINIPANVESIGETALAESKLAAITVADANERFIISSNCLIDTKSKRLVQALLNGTLPQADSITRLDPYCFAYTDIEKATIPEGITSIPSNAFSHCFSLKEVELPSTMLSLDATCFSWCNELAEVNLPEGLRVIYTYAFNETALTDVTIPSTIERVLNRSFGAIPTLKTVTFKKNVVNGELIVPEIAAEAFADSGSTDHKLVFNLPWSEDKTPAAPWGAINCELNYNYVEEESNE